jgi:magnesium-transporting ATPase (P-type)
MTSLLNEEIRTGDVIEMVLGDDVVTALVLLAADNAIILDALDGSTPFVVKHDELVEYRKFDPAI